LIQFSTCSLFELLSTIFYANNSLAVKLIEFGTFPRVLDGSLWIISLQPASPCLIGRLNLRCRLRFQILNSAQIINVPKKSFAAVLDGRSPTNDTPLPIPCIKGDTLCIKIGQEEYTKGLEECQNAPRGRLTLVKGDKPYTARDLAAKLGSVWKLAHKWKMVPLGKGYYDFHFESIDDFRKIWTAGTVNLKLGLLRLSQWTKDFSHHTQKLTHASIWIRLVELPRENWRERTLKEIASAVGTPIDIDGPTRNRSFGHYARILVDIDLPNRAYDEILVEREIFAFKVELLYERWPLFCHHCYSIGYDVTTCRWLHPHAAKAKQDRGKQPVVEVEPSRHARAHHGDDGASSSTIGGNMTWVSVAVATTTMVTQTALAESIQTFSSNSFRFALHNVTDHVPQGELPRPSSPVLEFVSPVAHVDMHSEEEEQLQMEPREVVKNPNNSDATAALSDVVEQEHSRSRELVESRKVSDANATLASPVATDDVQERSAELVSSASDREVSPILHDHHVVEHSDVQSKSPVGPISVRPILVEPVVNNIEVRPLEVSTASEVLAATSGNLVSEAHVEIHSNPWIQQVMELWHRIHEYDKKNARRSLSHRS